jgi:hypothetical protein
MARTISRIILAIGSALIGAVAGASGMAFATGYGVFVRMFDDTAAGDLLFVRLIKAGAVVDAIMAAIFGGRQIRGQLALTLKGLAYGALFGVLAGAMVGAILGSMTQSPKGMAFGQGAGSLSGLPLGAIVGAIRSFTLTVAKPHKDKSELDEL